jgi:kynureninase
MLAAHFSRFREANPGYLHFGAHSHHPWPDATQAAHEQYWRDAATRLDRKWEKVFGEVVPAAQRHVARLLALSDPGQVAFAPNTHEFVCRLFSCLDFSRPVRVLASAHEFHSFRRQARRLVETGRVELVEIPAEPCATFADRYLEAARRGHWDLLWLSHVFFDSGFVVADLQRIVMEAPAEPMLVVDGYHAFCALPVDLSAIHRRAFYIAGGYKYAMSGEGACFLAVPPGNAMRPVDTGWFASFETLSGAPGEKVPYADGAGRFWGSTFDPSGLYRFGAAMDWLQSTGTGIADIHRHAHALQARFLAGAPRLAPSLVPAAGVARGNFLTFDVDDAEALHRRILDADVYIDRRGRRLRFGFGVYHDEAAVDALLERLGGVLR